jgi:hypothetical protein
MSMNKFLLMGDPGSGHVAGLNKTDYRPGSMLRFQLIFKLTSNIDPNYLHIHTLKGIVQASRVSGWGTHWHARLGQPPWGMNLCQTSGALLHVTHLESLLGIFRPMP